MMSQAKKNNAMLGILWLSLGLLLILYVTSITFSNFNESTQPSVELVTSEYTESVPNVLMSRESSPRIILEPQLIIDQSKLSFPLDESYIKAYEMFKSKTIISDNAKNNKKQFQDFLELYGITINDKGMLVDVRGAIVPSSLIECQVMGYFPDKPYIKSNCT